MRMLIKPFIVIIISLFASNLYSTDPRFVKPEDLEHGWGLWHTIADYKSGWTFRPETLVWTLNVSPDGRWLIFKDDYYLKLMDLKTKEIKNIAKQGWLARWGPFSNIILYTNHEIDSVCLFDIEKMEILNKFPLGEPFGRRWAVDNYMYYAFPQGYPPDDSVAYRTNGDSLLQKGKIVNERIDGIKWVMQPAPNFPTNSVDYYLTRYVKNAPHNPYLIEGFDVVTDFNFSGRRKIRIEPPDTTWQISDVNSINNVGESTELIKVGPRGDVYTRLSFRTKEQLEKNYACTPPFDSAAIEARNASGWYRMDTTGENLVQLIRCWSAIGELTLPRDGETIYYAFLMPDTTTAIWKMDRFGKNKEMILKLELPTDVEESKEKLKDMFKLRCYTSSNGSQLRVWYKTNTVKLTGKMQIKIYNIRGRTILSKTEETGGTEEGTFNLDISQLKGGVYFILAESDGKRGSGKFVIYK